MRLIWVRYVSTSCSSTLMAGASGGRGMRTIHSLRRWGSARVAARASTAGGSGGGGGAAALGGPWQRLEQAWSNARSGVRWAEGAQGWPAGGSGPPAVATRPIAARSLLKSSPPAPWLLLLLVLALLAVLARGGAGSLGVLALRQPVRLLGLSLGHRDLHLCCTGHHGCLRPAGGTHEVKGARTAVSGDKLAV